MRSRVKGSHGEQDNHSNDIAGLQAHVNRAELKERTYKIVVARIGRVRRKQTNRDDAHSQKDNHLKNCPNTRPKSKLEIISMVVRIRSRLIR